MPDEGEAFITNLAVARFHGVGPVTARKMHALASKPARTCVVRPSTSCAAISASQAIWYYELARGQDDRPVQADRERKSSGSETTFPEDLTDPAQIEAGVIAMADEVWAWC